MDAAAARGRVGGDVLDVERAQHVDHEVGAGLAVEHLGIGGRAAPLSARIAAALGGAAFGVCARAVTVRRACRRAASATVAAPATAAPVRNLRRLTFGVASWAMVSSWVVRGPAGQAIDTYRLSASVIGVAVPACRSGDKMVGYSTKVAED